MKATRSHRCGRLACHGHASDGKRSKLKEIGAQFMTLRASGVAITDLFSSPQSHGSPAAAVSAALPSSSAKEETKTNNEDDSEP